jgi:hypothetical protein
LARDLTLQVANADEQPKWLPKEEWTAWIWPLPLLPPVQKDR